MVVTLEMLEQAGERREPAPDGGRRRFLDFTHHALPGNDGAMVHLAQLLIGADGHRPPTVLPPAVLENAAQAVSTVAALADIPEEEIWLAKQKSKTTWSAPGSELSSAISADVSRTTLVTLGLAAAVFQDLFGETDAGRRQPGKISLRVSKHLVAGLDVKSLGVLGDDDGVALGDAVALARLRRKDDASRCIHFEVVDQLLARHGDNARRLPLKG